MDRDRATVADLLALKGRRQLVMLHVESVDEAAAADEAGIDILSIDAPLWSPQFRQAAPRAFVCVGLMYGELATTEDYLRASFAAMSIGADSVYSASSLETISRMRAEGIPVCGHTGLIPDRRTWTGGFRAVGRTAESAMIVYRQVQDLERAGAFCAEIEVVPARVAAEISKRTSMLLLSMGSGAGCDAQYLFAEDVLGSNRGHIPRHAKVYRDFRSDYERLQQERISAFKEFAADVTSGTFPEPHHTVRIDDEEFDAFLGKLS
jgi:3-methyl-2-oxobutanoate hydroxymethyltransferase